MCVLLSYEQFKCNVHLLGFCKLTIVTCYFKSNISVYSGSLFVLVSMYTMLKKYNQHHSQNQYAPLASLLSVKFRNVSNTTEKRNKKSLDFLGK